MARPRPPILLRVAIFAGACLIFAGRGFAQSTPSVSPGGDTSTGLAGSFGGSIQVGGGLYDPYDRNESRTVVDMTVHGAVVPFSYTRIWNSRNGGASTFSTPANGCPIRGCRDNWSWGMAVNQDLSCEGIPTNQCFIGSFVGYPDGRVVQFNKPSAKDPPGTPGTHHLTRHL